MRTGFVSKGALAAVMTMCIVDVYCVPITADTINKEQLDVSHDSEVEKRNLLHRGTGGVASSRAQLRGTAQQEVGENAAVGARLQEDEQFYSYMSRWWRLHRGWMKSHNARLYQTLREHRALSISALWKPFLLRWHYVQPRLLQGYRYNWNDDGTYEAKRFLMKSSRTQNSEIVAARIRSVNNVCFPGLLSEARKEKLCTYDKRVSARAVQFTLEHGKFEAPILSVMRAYTSYVPKNGMHVSETDKDKWVKAKPAVSFVSVQGLHWNIVEMIEYCGKISTASGAAVPGEYVKGVSSPTRAYSLEFMEWNPIKMGRSQLDNGATVESIELKTKDEKIRILCVVPVSHPQSIDGSEIKLTQQKCSFYIRQWDFNLKCPEGKMGSLAMKTTVTARDDFGEGKGEPTLTPDFKNQLARNKNKVSMQFEQQAVLHVHSKIAASDKADSRSSVPVLMGQSKMMQWTSDPRFKSSRNVYFSFIVSDISKIREGLLNWDPEVSGLFKDSVQTNHIKANEVRPALDQEIAAAENRGMTDKTPSVKSRATSFMQVAGQVPVPGAASAGCTVVSLLPGLFAMLSLITFHFRHD